MKKALFGFTFTLLLLGGLALTAADKPETAVQDCQVECCDTKPCCQSSCE